MTFEELKRKANNKEIHLEDLEIEDILKFDGGEEGFINSSLMRNFDLPLEKIKSIRRKKKLNDVFYENWVRNLIVLYREMLESKIIPKEVFCQAMEGLSYIAESDANLTKTRKRKMAQID